MQFLKEQQNEQQTINFLNSFRLPDNLYQYFKRDDEDDDDLGGSLGPNNLYNGMIY